MVAPTIGLLAALLVAIPLPSEASLKPDDAFLRRAGDKGPLAIEEAKLVEERSRREVRDQASPNSIPLLSPFHSALAVRVLNDI